MRRIQCDCGRVLWEDTGPRCPRCGRTTADARLYRPVEDRRAGLPTFNDDINRVIGYFGDDIRTIARGDVRGLLLPSTAVAMTLLVRNSVRRINGRR